MPGATAVPNVLTDPGFLYTAVTGSTLPSNTVAGGVFTDSWPVAWVSPGATEDGSTFKYEVNIEPIKVAEFFDPIKYSTTERTGSFAFAMANWALTTIKVALNGGTLTVVSGTGATQLSSYVPPVPGAEARTMVGWESLDHTARLVCHQCINGGTVQMEFKKAPSLATVPTEWSFEIPSSGSPFIMYGAGTTRA